LQFEPQRLALQRDHRIVEAFEQVARIQIDRLGKAILAFDEAFEGDDVDLEPGFEVEREPMSVTPDERFGAARVLPRRGDVMQVAAQRRERLGAVHVGPQRARQIAAFDILAAQEREPAE
jgi:hypothetical protein